MRGSPAASLVQWLATPIDLELNEKEYNVHFSLSKRQHFAERVGQPPCLTARAPVYGPRDRDIQGNQPVAIRYDNSDGAARYDKACFPDLQPGENWANFFENYQEIGLVWNSRCQLEWIFECHRQLWRPPDWRVSLVDVQALRHGGHRYSHTLNCVASLPANRQTDLPRWDRETFWRYWHWG